MSLKKKSVSNPARTVSSPNARNARAKKKRTELKSSKNSAKKRVTTYLSPEEQADIILEHQEHSVRLAWSFLKTWRVKMQVDEVRSIANLALCETALRFDPSREVAFKTFFFYHLRGMLVKEIVKIVNQKKISDPLLQTTNNSRKTAAEVATDSIWPFPLIETTTPEQMLSRRETAQTCWTACSTLDLLEQEVVLRHFVKEQSLKQIAEELNYCRCHTSRVKGRAIKKLKRLLGGNIVDRDLKLTSGASLVRDKKRRDYTGGRGRRHSFLLHEYLCVLATVERGRPRRTRGCLG